MALDQEYSTSQAARDNTANFKQAVEHEKHHSIFTSVFPATVGFRQQMTAMIRRQYALQRNDWRTVAIKQGSNLIQAFTAGSLFYNAPNHSAGLFLKSGAIFVALLFNALLAQGEVTDSFSGRPVLSRHKGFALYHPATFNLAQIIVELPIQIFQISLFSVVLYFLVGLKVTASAFFLFWFIILSATICMTALFRAIGAAFPNFDAASKVSGLVVSSLLLYNGYMITKTAMHPWFVWSVALSSILFAQLTSAQDLLDRSSGLCIQCIIVKRILQPTYTMRWPKPCSKWTGIRFSRESSMHRSSRRDGGSKFGNRRAIS